MRHKDLARRTRGLKALGLLRNPHSEKGLKALVLSGRFVKRSFTHSDKPLKGPRLLQQPHSEKAPKGAFQSGKLNRIASFAGITI